MLTHVKEYPMVRKLSLPLAVLALAACGGGGDGTDRPVALTGAGATFPYPIYSKWFDAYHKTTGNQINYQSVGSGGGVRQYIDGTVDFGASDGPMNEEQLAAAGGAVHHLPAVLGAVVVTWNLPELGATKLKLDGAVIADIFLGKITKWNDQRIATLNPGVTLPDQDLIPVHRSDGSGTTYVFVDYLSKVSPEWQESVGRSHSVNWPVGIGGKGNEGVTQQVKQVAGAVGYVELIYAISNNLPYADVQNAAGDFVSPSLESVTAAAAGLNLPADTDFRVSITNSAGVGAYPISSFTWLLIRPENPDPAKARAIRDFLLWMVGPEARQMAQDLHYSPLPDEVSALVVERVGTLTSGGQPIP
jgi:phosphate transport system substrate-binding protein